MRRWFGLAAAAAAFFAVFAALLALDLANRGLAWRIAWSLTGEEAPAAQFIGLIELGGNLSRAQPRTEPFAPVNHVHDTPFGVNTFLQLEADPEVRRRSAEMIAAAGFTWLRQQFPWEDIEIHGRGDFEDRRNVGAVGLVDAWAKYDQIVGLAETYGLNIQARVDTPPRWTKANPDEGALAPPDDWEDYYRFLRIMAERYKGRITHYQIWNEPNIFPEWGNNPVNPEAYTAVLCRAYAELKAVDPAIVVHAAALSPTVSLTDRNLSDLIYLQRMYAAGVRGCFDVMSAQGYGFFSGPTDQRLRSTTLNFARLQYIRDIMVAYGDASVPLWISEAAWNPVDEPSVPSDIPGRENFGAVTQAQAAEYLPLAYQRASREWNWAGAIMVWFWKRPDESERGQPFYYFRMVEPDFTPLPVYDAMARYIDNEPPVLYPGTHQAEHRFMNPGETAVLEAASGAQFGQARRAESFAFTAQGTHVLVRWRGAALTASVNGAEMAFAPRPRADGWTTSLIATSLIGTSQAASLAGSDLLLDSVSVFDRTAAHLTPIAAAIGIVMLFEGALVLALLLPRRRHA